MAKLPFIDETLLAQTYPVIFHYTREQNLASILKTRGLYATDFQNTNDPEELRATRNVLVAAMVQAAVPLMTYARDIGKLKGLNDEQLLEIAKQDAEKLFDIGIRAIPTPPHITCFAAHIKEHHKENGLLTLWRLYGQHDGIALGFDTAKLAKITEAVMGSEAIDTIYLDKVHYGFDDPALLKRYFGASDIFQMLAKFLIAMLHDRMDVHQFSYDALLKFFVLICGSKHPDFSDESEIRLILRESIPGGENGRKPVMKPTKGRIVVKCLDALQSIMIGPRKDQDNIVGRVRRMLDDDGLRHVEILTTKTRFKFAGQ